MYIYQRARWPEFVWDQPVVASQLARVRFAQGLLLGRMQSYGFGLRQEASLETITIEIIKSSEIEGEFLNYDAVRSSIARKLGLDIGGMVPSDRNVDGVVEMMLEASQKFSKPLDVARLFKWHSLLFPDGTSGHAKIITGGWRDNKKNDPMQVISGPSGRQRVHFEAPGSSVLNKEMRRFLKWFEKEGDEDPVLKAAIAHLWFVTIHPFDDGNGRMARAITDMQLARADNNSERFYSMSAQIRIQRKEYYDILEETQKGSLDITGWLEWFLDCLEKAFARTLVSLDSVIRKAAFWDRAGQMDLNDRQKLMLNKILDGFDGNLTSSKWAKITKCSSDTALRDIQDLILKEILIKSDGGSRNSAYTLVV